MNCFKKLTAVLNVDLMQKFIAKSSISQSHFHIIIHYCYLCNKIKAGKCITNTTTFLCKEYTISTSTLHIEIIVQSAGEEEKKSNFQKTFFILHRQLSYAYKTIPRDVLGTWAKDTRQ